ncbi:MAG: hypothetical protein KF684_08140 [Phycisphaeraceae bacterium]|nr:hypothetical protein [Phycisphaeraceae bacterium]
MAFSNVHTAALLAVAGSAASAGTVESFWINAANGQWNTASRWTAPGTPGIAPRTNQIAVIDAVGPAYTISADVAGISLAGLRLLSDSATLRNFQPGFEVRGETRIEAGTIRNGNASGELIFNDLIQTGGLIDTSVGTVRFNGLAQIFTDFHATSSTITGTGTLRFGDGARLLGASGGGYTQFSVLTTLNGDVALEGGARFNTGLAFNPGALLRMRNARIDTFGTNLNVIAESGFNTIRGRELGPTSLLIGSVTVESGVTMQLTQGIDSRLDIVAHAGSTLSLGGSGNPPITNRFAQGSITSDGTVIFNGRNEMNFTIGGAPTYRFRNANTFLVDQDFGNVVEINGDFLGPANFTFRDSDLNAGAARFLGSPSITDPLQQPTVRFDSSFSLTSPNASLDFLWRVATNEGNLSARTIATNSLFVNNAGGTVTVSALDRALNSQPNQLSFLNFGHIAFQNQIGAPSMPGANSLTNFGTIELVNGSRMFANLNQHAFMGGPATQRMDFFAATLHAGSTTTLAGDMGISDLVISAGTLQIGGDLITTASGQFRHNGGDLSIGGAVRLVGGSLVSSTDPTAQRLFVANTDFTFDRIVIGAGGGLTGSTTVRFAESLDWIDRGIIEGLGARIIESTAVARVGSASQSAYLKANIRNEGLMLLSALAAVGASTNTLTNAEGAEIRADASSVIVSAPGTGTRRFEIVNNGTMDLRTAATARLISSSNTGLHLLNNADLLLGPGTTTIDILENAGAVSLDGGVLRIENSLRLLDGSALTGSGTIELRTALGTQHLIADPLSGFSGELRLLGNTRFLAGLDTDSTILLQNGPSFFEDDTTLRGALRSTAGTGTFRKHVDAHGAFEVAGGSILVDESLHLFGAASISSGSIGGAGAVRVAHSLNATGGVITGGELLVDAGAVADLAPGAELLVNRRITNSGSIRASGPGTTTVNGRVVNHADIEVNGRLRLLGGGQNHADIVVDAGAELVLGGAWLFESGSTLASEGTIVIQSGHSRFASPFTLASADALTITENASLSFDGEQQVASVENRGAFQLLDLFGQTVASFVQTESGLLSLAAATLDAGAALFVQGDASLSGGLELDFRAARARGEVEMLVLSASGISGEFGSVTLVGLPDEASVTLRYTPTEVVALVVVPAPGSLAALSLGAFALARRRRSAVTR